MMNIIEQYSVLIGILALIGIEISPIKFNPFTLLGKLCSKLLGIDELDKKIEKIDKKVDTNEIDRIKYEISQFSGSLRNGLKREEFDYQHIEDLYEKYRSLGGNSFVVSEMEFIRSCRNKIDK